MGDGPGGPAAKTLLRAHGAQARALVRERVLQATAKTWDNQVSKHILKSEYK